MRNHSRTSSGKRLAHQALGISALFHVAAVLLMANDWRTNLELAAESSGTPRTISLEAVFVERNDLGPAVDFAPIQIQPGVAWIAERRFVDRPAVAQDWELPARSFRVTRGDNQKCVRQNPETQKDKKKKKRCTNASPGC